MWPGIALNQALRLVNGRGPVHRQPLVSLLDVATTTQFCPAACFQTTSPGLTESADFTRIVSLFIMLCAMGKLILIAWPGITDTSRSRLAKINSRLRLPRKIVLVY